MNDSNKDARSQHARFIETARALGCDEDEAAFNEKLKAITRQKPKATRKMRPSKLNYNALSPFIQEELEALKSRLQPLRRHPQ